MNLAPVSLNNRNLRKTCNKQIVVEKRRSMLSVGHMLKYKLRFCREIKNKPLSTQYDLLLPPNAE